MSSPTTEFRIIQHQATLRINVFVNPIFDRLWFLAKCIQICPLSNGIIEYIYTRRHALRDAEDDVRSTVKDKGKDRRFQKTFIHICKLIEGKRYNQMMKSCLYGRT